MGLAIESNSPIGVNGAITPRLTIYKPAEKDGSYDRKVRSVDPLKIYLDVINAIPRLTVEEEAELGRTIQAEAGSVVAISARNKLAEANLRLAFHIAKHYTGNGLPFLDLIQEANLGLIEAADRFNPERGKFSDYAPYWIKEGIKRALSNDSRTVRVPVPTIEDISKLRKASQKLKNQLLAQGVNREPTEEELLQETGLKPSKLKLARYGQKKTKSLISPKDENSTAKAWLILDRSRSTVEDFLLRDDIEEVLNTLPLIEQQVIRLRLEINPDTGEDKTWEEVGQKIGKSRTRAQQIWTEGINRLKGPTRIKKLEAHI